MKKKSSTEKESTTAKNLEKKFDAGESVLDYFDAGYATKRINLDIPIWALDALDDESGRRGITRQALIKNWLIEKLDSLKISSKAS